MAENKKDYRGEFTLTNNVTGETFTGLIYDIKKKVVLMEMDLFLKYRDRVIECKDELEKSIETTKKLADEISDLNHWMNELLRA